MAALLDRGCDSNVLDLTGRTALQLAAGGGFTKMVALLLQVGHKGQTFFKISNLPLTGWCHSGPPGRGRPGHCGPRGVQGRLQSHFGAAVQGESQLVHEEQRRIHSAPPVLSGVLKTTCVSRSESLEVRYQFIF